MKTVFLGHFRPCPDSLENLWNNSFFVVDANVLLNLYRYSDTTKNELQNALKSVREKIFIPHQAAEEFMRNRLEVTSNQSGEYKKALDDILNLIKKLSREQHPFVSSELFERFLSVSDEVIAELKTSESSLLDRISNNDEILNFVADIFKDKTGKGFSDDELIIKKEEGELRIVNEIPPGYKDIKKGGKEGDLRKYGDFFLWQQIMQLSIDKKTSIVFVTDDAKEDWWLRVSGRTVGPRPELIKEFKDVTENDFWMYSVKNFMRECSDKNKHEISEDVYQEIDDVSQYSNKLEGRSIIVEQIDGVSESNSNVGTIIIKLSRDMPYATGSGKFFPLLISKPNDFNVQLLSVPDGTFEKNIYVSQGCGTNRDFNIHLKAAGGGVLKAGDYVFSYSAYCDDEPAIMQQAFVNQV